MAGLLPPVVADDAKDSTSKASTVELAIEYIKQLKAELADTRAQLAAATSTGTAA